MSRKYLLPLALVVAALALPSSAGAYVFWTAAPPGLQASVARINPDGSGLVPNVAGDVTFPTIVANSRYIFFQSQVVEGPGPEELGVPIWIRTNLDGGERIDLPGIPFNSEAIAVDEEHIYWEEPDGVNPPGVSRANLDGSDPELLYLTGLEGLGQFFAVYDGFLYWTYRYGDSISRANLTTKAVQEEFVPEFSGSDIPEEPLGIAVDSQGIFWTYHETREGEIGHAGLGGGSASLRFIGPAGAYRGPIAIDGSDLYWLASFSIARARLEGDGASVIDRHFVDDPGETLEGGLAVNSATSPPPPAPPPPPGPGTAPPASSIGPVPVSTPAKPPPPPPSLSVPKLTLNAKAGTATLTVTTPGPGKLVLSGAGVKRLSKTAKAAGPVRLNVQPSAKTAVKLKKHGKAKVTARLTFTPSAGPPTSRMVSLTLHLH
jgi:hypothetical protein